MFDWARYDLTGRASDLTGLVDWRRIHRQRGHEPGLVSDWANWSGAVDLTGLVDGRGMI